MRLEGERLILSKIGGAVAIGVDVGLKSFATLSDGTPINNPRFYRRDEADLKRVQQRKAAAKLAQDWSENAKQKGSWPRSTSGSPTGAATSPIA